MLLLLILPLFLLFVLVFEVSMLILTVVAMVAIVAALWGIGTLLSTAPMVFGAMFMASPILVFAGIGIYLYVQDKSVDQK